MSVSKYDTGPRAITRRLRPALCFIAAIFLLTGIALGTGYGSPPPVEQRYARAKAEVEALKSDAKRNIYRASWTELIKEFDEIYKLDPKWANRPAALFQAAAAAEELAKRSHARNDFKDAAERFENLATKHASSRLADDGLYRAAVIRGKILNDKKGALALIKRIKNQYAKGDMRPKAIALEAELEGDADKTPPAKAEKAPAPQKGKAAEEPRGGKKVTEERKAPAGQKTQASKSKAKPASEISQISWNTLDKKRVQLIIELDRPAAYKISVKDGNPAKRIPATLQLDIDNTKVLPQMKAGARVSGSMLSKVAVDEIKGGDARLVFDFSKIGRYTAKLEQQPFRIVIMIFAEGAMQKNERERYYGLPKNLQNYQPKLARTDSKPGKSQVRQVVATEDLAEQLGLTVQTVLIDAGHGGKDPGAVHNNVVERDIALDVAKRVGRLLADNGLNVEFSRKTDSYIALTSRTRMATVKRVDLFLSIHVNAHKDVNSEGFETYYLDLASNPQASRVAIFENAASDRKLGDMQSVVSKIMINAKSSESRRLALDLQRSAVSRIKKSGYNVRDGGVRGAPFHVLIGAPMPSVLVEVGYCTNPLEAKNLLSAIYRQKVSEGIAEGVLAYKNRLQRRSSAELDLQQKGT